MPIKQMGEKIASSVSAFFNDEKNLQTLDSMIELGLDIKNPDFAAGADEDLPLKGLSFIITGTLPKPRKDVEDLIENNGGHPSSALSAKTDFLIVGEEPGSKLRKAKSLGVRTISYPDLLKLIEERSGHPRLF